MASSNSNGNAEVAMTPLMAEIPHADNALDVDNDNDSSGNDPSDGKTKKKRRLFAWGSLRFHCPTRRQLEAYVTPGRRMDAWCGLLHYCVESFVYLLGPILILLASAIIGLLVYTYFFIVKDMLWLYYADVWYAPYIIRTHTIAVIYLMISVVFNYALCVCTSNIHGKSYNKVMREMATATGFVFPESPTEVEQFRKDYEDRMILRMQCRRQRAIEAANRKSNAIATMNGKLGGSKDKNGGGGDTAAAATNDNNKSSNNNQVTQRKNAAHAAAPPKPEVVRPWMVMGALEWGFCNRTQQPKPPRAHYCHVSRGLVFCLDHYCPWMFNSVGYFNYRYFVNFLVFACVSMLYGASLSYAPFILLSTSKYREQLRANKHHFKISNDHNPLPRMEPFLPYSSEKMYITLTFMLCLAVGLAVAMLCFFHIYLVLTSQTTIEFHGNLTNARRAKKAGKKWKNPYDLGMKRNFQQVYGSSLHPLLAILIPSSREPEYLPIPMQGDQGKRSTYASSKGHESRSKNKGDFVV